MIQTGIRVFVYGTLKGMGRGIYVGPARTCVSYRLYDGAFPILMFGGEESKKGYVLGEVYDILPSDLTELDAYEGYPDLYGRKQLHANVHQKTVNTGKTETYITPVWIYYGNKIQLTGRKLILPDANGNVWWGEETKP